MNPINYAWMHDPHNEGGTLYGRQHPPVRWRLHRACGAVSIVFNCNREDRGHQQIELDDLMLRRWHTLVLHRFMPSRRDLAEYWVERQRRGEYQP